MGRKRKNKEEKVMEDQNVQEEVVAEEVVEEPVEEVVEVSEEPVVEEVVEVSEEKTEAIGLITADLLYVRTGPGKDYDHSAILEKNTKVNVDLEYENEDFYKVVTSDGIEGYCMKKFVELI